MKLVDKVINHMRWMQENGVDISNRSGTKIMMSYYMSLGVTNNTTVTEWLVGMTNKKYPAYGSVTRAIRKARETNPQWQKPRRRVEKEVDNTKIEVGY